MVNQLSTPASFRMWLPALALVAERLTERGVRVGADERTFKREVKADALAERRKADRNNGNKRCTFDQYVHEALKLMLIKELIDAGVPAEMLEASHLSGDPLSEITGTLDGAMSLKELQTAMNVAVFRTDAKAAELLGQVRGPDGSIENHTDVLGRGLADGAQTVAHVPADVPGEFVPAALSVTSSSAARQAASEKMLETGMGLERSFGLEVSVAPVEVTGFL